MSIRRIVVLSVFMSVLLWPASGFTQTQDTRTTRVIADQTNLRDQPSTSGRTVATVAKGEELQVIAQSGTWWEVRVVKTGATGFVHSLVVEPVAAAVPLPATPPPTSPAPVANPAPPVQTFTPPIQSRRAGTASSTTLGITAGLNLFRASWDDMDEDFDSGYSPGLEAGVGAEIPLSDKFALAGQVLLARSTWKLEYEWFGREAVDTLRLWSVQVPLLARVSLGSTPSEGPFVEFGPTFSGRLSATVRTELDGESQSSTSVTDGVRRVGLAATLGAGVRMEKFSVGVRYHHGLLSLNGGFFEDLDADEILRERAISLLVTIGLK